MELIEKLPTRKNRNGHIISYGKFLCIHCGSIVEKILGKGRKQKSCGCQTSREISEANTGKIRTEEQRQKIATSARNRYKNPKNNPMYGKIVSEETRQKISEGNKGKIVSEETRQKQSKARKGKKQTKEFIESRIQKLRGQKRTEEQRQKMKDNHADFSLEKHPNWQDGKSFEIYPQEFNKDLKQVILIRDNYTCQCPDCEHTSERLEIHHINYDKNNNSSENLITLCGSCHGKTKAVKNRMFCVEFYQNIMMCKIMECLL